MMLFTLSLANKSTIVALVPVLIVVFSLAAYTYYLTPITTQEYSVRTWSGYVVEGPSPGSISNVTGSWTVPTVNCAKSVNSSVLVWVGIDGWNTQNETVEQIGTRADCSHGVASYVGWYEFWPRQPNTVTISNITIHPNDLITASVNGSNRSKWFSMKIFDETTKTSSHVRGEYTIAKLVTGEWIVEVPMNGPRLVMGNFTSFRFKSIYATVNGERQALISLTGTAGITITRLTFVCGEGTVKAVTSRIERIDNSFSITWAAGGTC